MRLMICLLSLLTFSLFAQDDLGLPAEPGGWNKKSFHYKEGTSRLSASIDYLPYVDVTLKNSAYDLESDSGWAVNLCAQDPDEKFEVGLFLFNSEHEEKSMNELFRLYMGAVEGRVLQYWGRREDARLRWDLTMGIGAAYAPGTDFQGSDFNGVFEGRTTLGIEYQRFRFSVGAGGFLQGDLGYALFGLVELTWKF